MSKTKNAEEIEQLAESIAQDFKKVLKKHGLQDYQIANFSLMSAETLTVNTLTANEGSGYWVWKCWQTPQGIRCGWVWVNN